MENASKALLMAAGVLIGILILAFGVYLFTQFGGTSALIHGQIESDRINQFNSQFTSYEGKDDITIYNILTVVNLAKDNNEYYELTTQESNNYYISVTAKINGSTKTNLERYTQEQLEELIKNEQLVSRVDPNDPSSTVTGLPLYSCKVTVNPNTQRVSKVEFNTN